MATMEKQILPDPARNSSRKVPSTPGGDWPGVIAIDRGTIYILLCALFTGKVQYHDAVPYVYLSISEPPSMLNCSYRCANESPS